MDLRTSSTVSLWASRSSSILCSSSLMRRSESSCALWRDSLTACLWVLSSCSCASSDPFSSRIFPLSSRSWPSVLWTCSRYCLCASSRPSTSSRRSWRRRTSPSSWALRTPARWALDSPSSLDLATASSSSAAFFFASSRSFSRLRMVESRCSSSVSFSSSWLCSTLSPLRADASFASRVCSNRSCSCLSAIPARSSSFFASSRSLLSRSPSCWWPWHFSSISRSRCWRSATRVRCSSWALPCCACASPWSSSIACSRASNRRAFSATSASSLCAVSTSVAASRRAMTSADSSCWAKRALSASASRCAFARAASSSSRAAEPWASSWLAFSASSAARRASASSLLRRAWVVSLNSSRWLSSFPSRAAAWRMAFEICSSFRVRSALSISSWDAFVLAISFADCSRRASMSATAPLLAAISRRRSSSSAYTTACSLSFSVTCRSRSSRTLECSSIRVLTRWSSAEALARSSSSCLAALLERPSCCSCMASSSSLIILRCSFDLLERSRASDSAFSIRTLASLCLNFSSFNFCSNCSFSARSSDNCTSKARVASLSCAAAATLASISSFKTCSFCSAASCALRHSSALASRSCSASRNFSSSSAILDVFWFFSASSSEIFSRRSSFRICASSRRLSSLSASSLTFAISRLRLISSASSSPTSVIARLAGGGAAPVPLSGGAPLADPGPAA
mmetsp:Transcript_28605/g.81800  ORF Transcript_28605/g.81800 Transcript_28605/m.81800 type:complete len:687 (-) Transcript_28605:1-2061(-)